MRNLQLLRSIACSTSMAALLVGCQTSLPTERLTDSRPARIADVRPPPLTGGTLLISSDERFAVASDPERDRVVIVTLTSRVVRTLALEAGDEPARLVEDASGNIHVALRRGGAVVTLDPESATLLSRRPVCSEPRGVAVDSSRGLLYTACASGELVLLRAEPDGAVLQRTLVEPDLRDVVVQDHRPVVSTFRSAELLDLDGEGTIQERSRPAAQLGMLFDSEGEPLEVRHVPQVAWRMLPIPGTNKTVMIHQLSRATAVDLTPPEPVEPVPGEDMNGVTGEQAAYAPTDTCDSNLVLTASTVFGEFGTALGSMRGTISLPIDAAISNDGQFMAVIDPTRNGIIEFFPEDLEDPDEQPPEVVGDEIDEEEVTILSDCHIDNGFVTQTDLTPIAVAYGNSSELLYVQTREPATLSIYSAGALVERISFGGVSMEDTGLDMFHNLAGQSTLSGLSCASCHPEGRDDGHVWNFGDDGIRRTQSLAGTLEGTAPFHWEGDLSSMNALITEVFTGRMGGPQETPDRVLALQTWLEQLRPVRPVPALSELDEEAPARGQELFESSEVGCATCHSGPAFTNNQTVDVGSGGKFQVPSLLGIGLRAPYMHDGCAKTLADRFTACGGDQHGDVSQLDLTQLEDLVAYLETL